MVREGKALLLYPSLRILGPDEHGLECYVKCASVQDVCRKMEVFYETWIHFPDHLHPFANPLSSLYQDHRITMDISVFLCQFDLQ